MFCVVCVSRSRHCPIGVLSGWPWVFHAVCFGCSVHIVLNVLCGLCQPFQALSHGCSMLFVTKIGMPFMYFHKFLVSHIVIYICIV